jgi:hypothetical protein
MPPTEATLETPVLTESCNEAVDKPASCAVQRNSEEGDDTKAEFKRQFMVFFQQFMAEGATQTEAAARALKVVSQ